MDDKRKKRLNQFEGKIGYKFSNLNLLDQALTHNSVLTDNKGIPTYQRLEWLGDSLLKQAISVAIFTKNPGDKEGDLTYKRKELEGNEKLKRIAISLNIKHMEVVRFHPSFEKAKFDKFGDFVEAIIGAIYWDASNQGNSATYGMREINNFIKQYWKIDTAIY